MNIFLLIYLIFPSPRKRNDFRLRCVLIGRRISYWLSMGVTMEKGVETERERMEGRERISQTRITTTHHCRFLLLLLLLFSLRALIPCPAKHWANVELFRSLVRSMTRRAHLHLCCFSSIVNIEIGCHSIFNKRKITTKIHIDTQTLSLCLSTENISFLTSDDVSRNKCCACSDDYYANEHCIDISSFRLSIDRSCKWWKATKDVFFPLISDRLKAANTRKLTQRIEQAHELLWCRKYTCIYIYINLNVCVSFTTDH